MAYDSIESIPEDIYLATILNEVDEWDEEDVCPNCGKDVDVCDCDEDDDFFDDTDIEE